MSRIGRMAVNIPSGVQASVAGQKVTIKGPKGDLGLDVHPAISVDIDGDDIRVSRSDDENKTRALHGLTRSLLANMVHGVSQGFQRRLQIVGVGYRAEKTGSDKLTLALGFSHPVVHELPPGITVEVPKPTEIVVHGADKQVVGQVASDIRRYRPPEPYKGKGVRYEGERIHRKAGKAG